LGWRGESSYLLIRLSSTLLGAEAMRMARTFRISVFSTVFVAMRLLTGAAFCDEPVQTASSKTLQKIQMKLGRVRFGFVLKGTSDELLVLDIQSNSDVRLKRSEIMSVSSENAEVDAVKRMGFPLVLSWKVKQSETKRAKTGKVAKVEGALVYVTLGKTSGLAVGDFLNVYRGDAEIRDPDTKEILGRERKLVGQLTVTDAQNSFSKARLLGEIDVEFKVGDQVEPKVQADALAVLPFAAVSDGATAAGVVLAEQLTTELSKRGVPVVDRAHFGRVLEELATQQSALFDQTKVQQLGRNAGAFAILTGTIAQRDRRTSEVNCRLIEVDTGRVVFSESYLIPSAQPSPVPSAIPDHSASINPKSSRQRPASQPIPSGRAKANTTHLVEAIAHWPLDGDGKNVLGNSLNGSLIGRPTFEGGRVNLALVLNGRDQYFSVPHDDAFDAGQGDFSIALWVRLDGNSESNPIASKGSYGWKRGWVLDLGANGKRGVIRLETKGDSERAPGLSQTSTKQDIVSSGEWHHIAVVVKKSSGGQNIAIYVDGTMEASGHIDQVSLDNSDADFYLGRIDVFHLGRVEKVFFLRGAIDDVWFFRGAISAAQVRSLMGGK
jgi:TolB-like protein